MWTENNSEKGKSDCRMTREEAIQILSTRDAHGVLCGYTSGVTEALDMAIEALSNIETDPDVETGLCETCKYYETNHKEYPCSDCTFGNSYYIPADTISEDTQTEERARLVVKETELAHVAAKLENAEKRLQLYKQAYEQEIMDTLAHDNTKDCTKFLLWLLEEIMDEENWEMNAVADGEVIARKLTNLGLLEVKDGYYVRTSLTHGLQEEERESILDRIKNWRKNHV